MKPCQTVENVLALTVLAAGLSCGGQPQSGTSDADLAAPSDLKVIAIGTDAHIAWKDNSGGKNAFELERKTAGTFARIETLAANVTSHHDGTTSGGQTYTYRIRAVAGSQRSSYSNEARVDIPAGGAVGSNLGGNTGATGGAGMVGNEGGRGGTAGGGMGTGGATGSVIGSGGRGGTMGGAGAGGANATDGSPVRDAGVMDAASAPVSFRRDIAPKLQQGCGSTMVDCHARGQADGRSASPFFCKVAWLSTVDAPAGAAFAGGPNMGKSTGCPDLGLYDRLTQIRSMLCGDLNPRPLYVVPGSLPRSLLYQVIAGDPSMGGGCTTVDATTQKVVPVGKMPKAPIDKLGIWNAAAIKQLADWITAGAPNN